MAEANIRAFGYVIANTCRKEFYEGLLASFGDKTTKEEELTFGPFA